MIYGPPRDVEARQLTTRVPGRPLMSRDRRGKATKVDGRSHRSRRLALVHGIARKLTSIMDDRDIAASELAAAVGLSDGAVLSHVSGRATPGIWTLLAYAEALGCNLADFLPDDELLR